MADLGTVVERVDERVAPDEEERERMERAAADLEARAREAIADLPVEADVLRVGSTARGTWLSGDRDIDMFVRFPTSLDRDRLEEYGLRVGRAVLPDGHEEYAEHPYVTGTHAGFDVDLVPCYDVDRATEIRSAVDRTPFHTAYLAERLDADLAGDVRALKRLLKSVGAYGSDLRTRGFSGYLTELLVLAEGGAVPLFEAAADWSLPVRYDPADHGTVEFDDPLVMIDPTDPERNVAAVCAPEHVGRFQHYARDLLADPRTDPFFRSPPEPLSPDAVRDHVERRGTTPLAVVFDAPNLVEDQLYPQLRRSLAGITADLDRRGFEPLRSRTFADDRAVLLVEVAVPELPAVERHEGPPVDVREHATGFYEAYADDPDVYGPYLDGTRYVVERPRETRTAREVLAGDALFDVALGARVADALREGYEVLAGPEVATLAEEATFGRELAAYFDPQV
ncbi:MAG: CCA tRNA nucleotidyltransferase [Haloferacaceae archaeon]